MLFVPIEKKTALDALECKSITVCVPWLFLAWTQNHKKWETLDQECDEMRVVHYDFKLKLHFYEWNNIYFVNI